MFTQDKIISAQRMRPRGVVSYDGMEYGCLKWAIGQP